MADVARRLLMRIVVLAALLVGAVVATAKADVWWMVTVAVAVLVAAAVDLALSVARMLRADDLESSGTRRRGLAAAVVVVAGGAVVLAISLPVADSATASTARPTAGAAAQTVREFLASAVLDDNAYVACQDLTPGGQEQIARLAGGDQTCRDALTATQPSFDGVYSEGALEALRLRAVVRGATADVTAAPHGRAAVTFVLRRTTGGEAAAYEAPPDAWRIVVGGTAVLRA